MKWDEIKDRYPATLRAKLEKTDIDCPDCGKKVYMRTDIILTTYPPQYQYECECGWVGYSFAKV